MIEKEPKFHHNDPEYESMNNFHVQMPGGIHRPNRKGSMGELVFGALGHYLDMPEELWPKDEMRTLKRMQVVRAVQKDIDDFLLRHPNLLRDWQTVQPISDGGLSYAIRERVLRPVYVELRKRYSEEDLSK